MHRERLRGLLGLSDGDISAMRLRPDHPSREKSPRKPKIDYSGLACSYREIMNREGFTSQFELRATWE